MYVRIPSLLAALACCAALPAAAERPPPPIGAPALEDEGLGAAETEKGIKKKKEKAKKRANEPVGGGGGCIFAPSCGLGGIFGLDEGRDPWDGGGDPPPRRPRGGKRPKLKKYWFDADVRGALPISTATTPDAPGADAMIDVQLRFEVRDGIGFDGESFTLLASDGTLPTYAFHLSFGHVTKRLRVRMGGGVRVLDFGDPDVAQIWGFETGPSIDYQLTKRWKWDATALYGQFPGSLVTGMLATGFSYGEHVAPRVGYRVFLWEGVDHGPELGVSLRF